MEKFIQSLTKKLLAELIVSIVCNAEDCETPEEEIVE
jgi:hypothetical protein